LLAEVTLLLGLSWSDSLLDYLDFLLNTCLVVWIPIRIHFVVNVCNVYMPADYRRPLNDGFMTQTRRTSRLPERQELAQAVSKRKITDTGANN
jgi:hypothetical protein